MQEILRLYAIVRNDAGMPPGKCSSQAGHAFIGSFFEAQKLRPDVASHYASESPGTKVCLQASLDQLCRAQFELEQAGLPHYLVIDSGCPNFFNGEPTITALGFGPCTEDEVPKLITKLNLL